MGTLYYSMAMARKGRGPFCAGVSQAVRPETQVEGVEVRPSDALGDFKYACLGYSIHHAKGKNETGALQLPQCEGLEVLATTAAPEAENMLLDEAGPTREEHDTSQERPRKERPEPWPARNIVETDDTDDRDFAERFVRMAGLIVKKGKELSSRILGI